jgi:outer membrane protein TolC
LRNSLARTLRYGIRRATIDMLESEIAAADLDAEHRRTVEEELEAARERQDQLRGQIDRLRNLLEASQKSIGLNEDHFRAAISCALELVGAESLKPVPAEEQPDGPARGS